MSSPPVYFPDEDIKKLYELDIHDGVEVVRISK